MSLLTSLPPYYTTDPNDLVVETGRGFQNFNAAELIFHSLIDRFKANIPILKELLNYEGNKLLTSKVISNNMLLITYLDKYFPNSNDQEIFFEEDDDNSLLNFIEIGPHNIIINVFEDRIEYSYENEDKPNSLIVSQISFEERKIIKLIEELIKMGGLNRQSLHMNPALKRIFHLHPTSSDTSS